MSIQTHRVSRSLLFATILFFIGPDRPAWAGNGVWTPVGPGCGTWWESDGVASITVHPGSPGSLWVGMPQGGVYRSSDRGVNWRWAGGPFISHLGGGLAALAADPSRPARLWAATGTKIFRTDDGGAHWTQATDESYSAALGDASRPELVAAPGALYAVTNQKLLASSDGGRTWETLYEQAPIGSFAAASARVLYLAVNGELQQSLDGGQTWAAVASGPPGVRQIVLAPAAVYVAAGGNVAGLLRSTDQGRTWRPVLGGTRSRPFEVYSVAADPRAPRTLYVSGSALQGPGLWVSRNAGGSWTKVRDSTFSQLQLDSSAGALYANYYGHSVQRSLDGGVTWTTVLRAPDSEWSEAARIKFRPGDPARAALAVGFTLYRSVNGGATWKLSNIHMGMGPYAVDLDPADPNRLIASTDGGVLLSDDAGQTWHWAIGSGWSMRYLEILVRTDAQTLLTGGAGMFRSGDNGRSWQNVLPAWPTDSDATRWVQKIEADPVHPSIIYALAFVAELDGLPHGPFAGLGFPSFLWRSTDSGKTWKKVTQDLSTFAVDPATSRLYGVRGRQLLASDDGGKTWRQAGQAPGAWDLVIDPTNPEIFYMAPRLWRSRDRGATWTLVNDQWVPEVLTFDPRDSRILYGADCCSVYTITVPD